VERPKGRREDAVWRNAPVMELEDGSKGQRMLEEINWRDRCPKMGQASWKKKNPCFIDNPKFSVRMDVILKLTSCYYVL
jgi:hypothetical protein